MRRLLRFVGKSAGSPHAVALGMAIGFLIGWMPFFGMQMALSILLCHLLRANKLVPLIPVWLTNPVTFVPINTVNYWVGWKLVGGPPLSTVVKMLERIAFPPTVAGMGWIESWWECFKASLHDLLAMGWGMLFPFCLGSFIVGMILAVVSYFVTRRFVAAFREAVRQKKQRNRDRRRARSIIISDRVVAPERPPSEAQPSAPALPEPPVAVVPAPGERRDSA